MGLRDIEATLPPGFRFYPSDEELVCHYLYKKIANEEALKGTLVEIDLHTCEPWQLPDVAKLNSNEWYFFSFRDRKYATGFRTNRATTSGYWKATGKDRIVLDPATRQVVGMRKTLVFYRNRAPNGIKTGWIMHEFRLETPHMPPKEDWVLCRVFHKSKGGDNSTGAKLSPVQDMIFDPAATASPPTSTIDLGKPCGNFHHPQITSTPPHNFHTPHPSCNTNNNQQTTFLNLAVSNLGFLTAAPSEFDTSKATQEELGFLWDMSLEENDHQHDQLGHGVPPCTAVEMRFEDDNNMVFL